MSLLALSLLAYAAPQVSHTQQKGDWVYGTAYQSDDCSYTYLWIWGASGVSHGSGQPNSYSDLYIDYYTFNYCTWEYGGYFGTAVPGSVSLNGRTGKVSASATLYDYWTGESMTADVSVTVSGDGYTYRGMDSSTYQWQGGTFRYRTMGTSQDGTAIATINGVTLADGYGSFGTSTSGTFSKYEY